jgi:hypothetical protein
MCVCAWDGVRLGAPGWVAPARPFGPATRACSRSHVTSTPVTSCNALVCCLAPPPPLNLCAPWTVVALPKLRFAAACVHTPRVVVVGRIYVCVGCRACCHVVRASGLCACIAAAPAIVSAWHASKQEVMRGMPKARHDICLLLASACGDRPVCSCPAAFPSFGGRMCRSSWRPGGCCCCPSVAVLQQPPPPFCAPLPARNPAGGLTPTQLLVWLAWSGWLRSPPFV